MIFRVIFILAVALQLHQTTRAESLFNIDEFENRVTNGASVKQIIPEITKMMKENVNQVMNYIQSQVVNATDYLENYQRRAFLLALEYLQKVGAAEVAPIKRALFALNTTVEYNQNQLVYQLKSIADASVKLDNILKVSIEDKLNTIQKIDLDVLVGQIKKDIIESFKSEAATVQTALISEITLLRNETSNKQTECPVYPKEKVLIGRLEEKNEIKETTQSVVELIVIKTQAIDERLKKLEENIEKLINAESNSEPSPRKFSNVDKTDSPNTNKELIDLLEDKFKNLTTTLKPSGPETNDESLESKLESIKSIVEAMNEEQDVKSDELISKLEGKIRKLLTLKLKSKSTTCDLSRATKATLAAIQTATESLVESLAETSSTDQENKLEGNSEVSLTELNASTTDKFNEINTKLDTIQETANRLDETCLGVTSDVKEIFTTELNKFSGTELNAVKKVINETLATILVEEFTKMKSSYNKNDDAVSMAAMKVLGQGVEKKLIAELNKVSNSLSKAINQNIVRTSVIEDDGISSEEAKKIPPETKLATLPENVPEYPCGKKLEKQPEE